jgi:hypothetical protein
MNNETPRLVPSHNEYDVNVYIVLSDDLDRANVETDEAEVVEEIMNGAYSHPARVVAFNTARGWSCDVTEDIAIDVLGKAQRTPLQQARKRIYRASAGRCRRGTAEKVIGFSKSNFPAECNNW